MKRTNKNEINEAINIHTLILLDLNNNISKDSLDVLHEGGAAGGGEQALLGELAGLGQGDHIRAQRRLDDVVETQLL